MTRRPPRLVRDDDDGDESPLAADIASLDDTITTCPHCRRTIYRDNDDDPCPRCGKDPEQKPRRGTPLWVMITAVVLLVMFVLFSLRIF